MQEFANASALATSMTGAMVRTPATYLGPERRAVGRDPASCLLRMLDEIDYGMLLVDAEGRVSYLNHAARVELDGAHPLQLRGAALSAHHVHDVAPLFDALAAAQRGLRRLLTVGQGSQRVSISVVPLADPLGRAGPGSPVTLLLLGKREICARLSVQGFARSYGLTPAETRVLEGLCDGVKPRAIAKACDVAESTVRTQIAAIRNKTGAGSIRELVGQVALLPPIQGALRNQLRTHS